MLFPKVKDGETIRLEKNVQLDNTVNINKSTTVDLNGKTITSDTVAFKAAIQDGTFTIKDSKENGKITSNNKSNLIEIKEGELVVEGGELSNDWYVVYVYQSGKATIHGGTLVSDVASAVSTNGSAAGQENYSGNAVITITGGEVTSTNDVAVYLPAGKLNISDGKITGATAVYCKAGTTNITGGEITGTGAKAEFVHSNNGCSATGDAIVIEACNYPNGNPAFEISDGKVISQNANAIGSYNTDNNSAEKLEVSGGEYSSSVAEYVVDSLNAELHKSSGDALYSYYTSVENAIAAASANDTVTDLTAAASNDTFTVTLNYTNEVTPTVKYTLEEKDDTKFTFPANNPSRSGYTFLGWKTENDDKLYKAEEEYSVTTNVEFTAQWSRNSSGGSGGGSSTPSYTISADKADNGSVSVSPQSAKKGDTVTVTLKPESGYELDKLTVKDSDGKEVTVTDKGDGKYTFTMPASKVTVSAAFKKTAAVHDCPSKNFTDVDTAQWYHEGVDYVVEKGMMNGVSSTSFAPNADTTRGMIVTILYRLEGSPAVASAASFSDVAAGQYYADAVAWASANGIVTGYDSSKFGPNDKITREQLAAILYRYAGFKKYDVSKTSDLSSYTDSASISGYAADALKWANAESLINGVGDSRIAPQGSAVRAQAATILMRFCENVAK